MAFFFCDLLLCSREETHYTFDASVPEYTFPIKVSTEKADSFLGEIIAELRHCSLNGDNAEVLTTVATYVVGTYHSLKPDTSLFSKIARSCLGLIDGSAKIMAVYTVVRNFTPPIPQWCSDGLFRDKYVRALFNYACSLRYPLVADTSLSMAINSLFGAVLVGPDLFSDFISVMTFLSFANDFVSKSSVPHAVVQNRRDLLTDSSIVHYKYFEIVDVIRAMVVSDDLEPLYKTYAYGRLFHNFNFLFLVDVAFVPVITPTVITALATLPMGTYVPDVDVFDNTFGDVTLIDASDGTEKLSTTNVIARLAKRCPLMLDIKPADPFFANAALRNLQYALNSRFIKMREAYRDSVSYHSATLSVVYADIVGSMPPIMLKRASGTGVSQNYDASFAGRFPHFSLINFRGLSFKK